MRVLIATALLALSACSQPKLPVAHPGADGAGNHIESLTAQLGGSCTSDTHWCVNGASDSKGGYVARVIYSAANGPRDVASFNFSDDATHDAWPQIVRLTDDTHVLVGFTRTQTQSYSGGGASAVDLTLYALSADHPGAGASSPVLTAPLSGQADIRACFSEADTAARREACSDQYNFSGTLAIDPTVTSGAPRFVLSTEATTYPGKRSRGEDSTQAPPLSAADLTTATDATCTYRRVFAPNAAGIYAPDSALPACADYLQP